MLLSKKKRYRPDKDFALPAFFLMINENKNNLKNIFELRERKILVIVFGPMEMYSEFKHNCDIAPTRTVKEKTNSFSFYHINNC